MEGNELFGLVFTLSIFAGVFIIYMGLRQRSQQLEMQHRERMAMIERGQVPPSEASVVHSLLAGQPSRGLARSAAGMRGVRSISVGIVIVSVGLGLMTIISIAGDSPEVGVGVGGAIGIVGLAFIVIGMVSRLSVSSDYSSMPSSAPSSTASRMTPRDREPIE